MPQPALPFRRTPFTDPWLSELLPSISYNWQTFLFRTHHWNWKPTIIRPGAPMAMLKLCLRLGDKAYSCGRNQRLVPGTTQCKYIVCWIRAPRPLLSRKNVCSNKGNRLSLMCILGPRKKEKRSNDDSVSSL